MESYRKLYRSTDSARIGGVASGLGEYLGVDPTIVRIIFCVLTVVGGSGILLYSLLWIFVPRDPDLSDPDLPRRSGLFGLLLKALAIAVCIAVVTDQFGSTFGAIAFVVGLLVGLYFYWRSTRSDDDPLDLSNGLYRSTTDKTILGVFGGLAEVLGVNPTMLRIAGGVLLFAAFPVTVAVYLLLGMLLPKRGITVRIE